MAQILPTSKSYSLIIQCCLRVQVLKNNDSNSTPVHRRTQTSTLCQLMQINAFLALTIIGAMFAVVQFLVALLGAIATSEVYCPSNVYCREVRLLSRGVGLQSDRQLNWADWSSVQFSTVRLWHTITNLCANGATFRSECVNFKCTRLCAFSTSKYVIWLN